MQCGMLRRFELLKNEAKQCSKKAIPAPVQGFALLITVRRSRLQRIKAG